MGVNRIDHAAVLVEDLGRALEWYEGSLGLTVPCGVPVPPGLCRSVRVDGLNTRSPSLTHPAQRSISVSTADGLRDSFNGSQLVSVAADAETLSDADHRGQRSSTAFGGRL